MDPARFLENDEYIPGYDQWASGLPLEKKRKNMSIHPRLFGGYITFSDNSTEEVTISSGERYTPGSSYSDLPNIYVLGPCIAWGGFVNNEGTIESFLQKLVEGKYNVHNMICDNSSVANRLRSLFL